MTWFRFRAQGARNVSGAVVTTGLGKIYATTDTGFATPVAVRATASGGVPVALGTGALLPSGNVAVTNGVTEEFDADLPTFEAYWKSGSSPAVALISATGALADVATAKTAAQTAQTAATTAQTAASTSATAAAASAAELAARPGSGHFVLASESTPVPAGLPEDTIIVVLGA